jgi:Chemotaxis phosphatase CheX
VQASPDLRSALPDLETLLVEMISMVLGEEATLANVALPDVPLAISRLIIHDSTDDFYLGVEMRAEGRLATLLTTSLLAVEEPEPGDVLDVIAELGNIAAGNVKTLISNNARLSLPTSVLSAQLPDDPPGTVRAVATLLDHVIELVVMPASGSDSSTRWPPGFDQI